MPDENNTNTQAQSEPNTQDGGNTEPRTYTEEEVMKLLQSESDRRVTSALEKQKKKYEEKLSLSKLDENERAVAEKDIKIKELESKLKDFQVLQNKQEVIKVLSARGLNASFADIISIGDDLEEAQRKIDTLDKLYKDAVAAEVKKRLSSDTPKAGSSSSDKLTKEEFRKMTIAQQSKIYQENPELYLELSK